MIRKILITIIYIYQKIPGPWHKMCRHIPTCSNYFIEALEVHGTIKGCALGVKRFLRCNPFGSFGFDPVPSRKEGRKNEII